MLIKDPSLRINAREIDSFLDENFNVENLFRKMEINSEKNQNKRYSCNNDCHMKKQ